MKIMNNPKKTPLTTGKVLKIRTEFAKNNGILTHNASIIYDSDEDFIKKPNLNLSAIKVS